MSSAVNLSGNPLILGDFYDVILTLSTKTGAIRGICRFSPPVVPAVAGATH